MKIAEKKRKLEEKQARAEAYRLGMLADIQEKAAKKSAAITGEKREKKPEKKPEKIYHITLTYGQPNDYQNTA